MHDGVDMSFERLLSGFELGDEPVDEVDEELRTLGYLLAELSVVNHHKRVFNKQRTLVHLCGPCSVLISVLHRGNLLTRFLLALVFILTYRY
jgi:hypothetical protein